MEVCIIKICIMVFLALAYRCKNDWMKNFSMKMSLKNLLN